MNIKLKESQDKKIGSSDDIYSIMQKILMRENKIDRNREHLWTISLDTANKILNIELVSMGTINRTLIEPMEVFSVPLQKRAVKIILVHNHPSNEIKPSAADEDITDRLIQCGLMLHVPVLDHLIITEKTYFSFKDYGLLEQLQNSKKYVPEYKIREGIKKQVEEEVRKSEREQQAREMAKAMKQNGVAIEIIVKVTGLSEQTIKRIKTEG
jgi:DNA repair protein RadC